MAKKKKLDDGKAQEMPESGDENEEEDEDDAGGLTSLLGNNASGEMTNQEMEAEKLRLLLSNFDDEQMNRYEVFRRANINRPGVKKLANAVLNQSITANVAVVLSGISKVFIGEIIEKAKDVQLRMNQRYEGDDTYENGSPLLPEHVREAWRMYKLESGQVPAAHWRRQGGGGDGRMFR